MLQTYLLLHLEGAMASWPSFERSLKGVNITYKGCESKPTEAALFGILEAALGYSHLDDEKKEALEKALHIDIENAVNLNSVSSEDDLPEAWRDLFDLPVLPIRSHVFKDFQTGTQYLNKVGQFDSVERCQTLIQKKREIENGESKNTLSAISEDKEPRPLTPTIKEYTTNVNWAVKVYGDLPLLKEIAFALKHPVFTLCLGRINCLPTAPVYAGIFQEDQTCDIQ